MTSDHRFIDDGPERYEPGEQVAARLMELRETIAAEYADRLAQAGLWERMWLGRQMREEFKRRSAEIVPSPESLWLEVGAE